MEIRFLGHACFELTDGDTTLLIDPFLSGNPKAAVSAEEVQPTVILLTHGHQDHFGDTVEIAKRTGAPVVAITELAGEIASRSDTLATISRKVRAYIDVGVGAVWVVNPWLRTVEVFRADGHHTLLSESDALRGDPVVPSFSVDLARIFPS